MRGDWYRSLYAIDSAKISALLFVRVGASVGVPMFGFGLAGHVGAATAGGATALFVTMCDIGTRRRDRVAVMATATLFILVGGFVGHRFGVGIGAAAAFVLASTLVAGWVSNSQPAISAIARFGALATAAGAGIQNDDPLAAIAVVAGGACAILSAVAIWLTEVIAPHADPVDWRAGVRRAFAGADTGWWFALCYASGCALALLAADTLHVSRPVWATFTVIMVTRREGMISLGLVLQYMAGTLLGIPVAALLAHLSTDPVVLMAFATLAAAGARQGLALNPSLGYMAFTVFLIMIVEVGRHGGAPELALVLTRLYDVGVGCVIALGATLLATLGRGDAPARPPTPT